MALDTGVGAREKAGVRPKHVGEGVLRRASAAPAVARLVSEVAAVTTLGGASARCPLLVVVVNAAPTLLL